MHRYFYHMTTSQNLESIRKNGLMPHHTKKFAPLSPEAQDGRAKIFLLPRLNGIGMRGFIKEWWHGDRNDIIILRCSLTDIHKSQDAYYAKQECWIYENIPASELYIRNNGKWISINKKRPRKAF